MTIAISFAAYTLLIIGVGLFAGRTTKGDDEDYFLAGRKLGPWIAALSAGASGSSAWVTMGLVGLAFADGLRAYWIIPGVIFGVAFNWFCLASKMRSRSVELGAVTIPDLLSMHFKERWPVLRLMSVVVILLAMVLYVASQMAAAGEAFAGTFDRVSYPLGVGLGAAIVLAYTVSGGFRSTCWTDAVQAILMLVGLVGMPAYILLAGQAPADIFVTLQEANPSLVRWLPEGGGMVLLGFLVGSGALGINLGYPGQPHVLVRLMAVRDQKDITRSGVIQCSWAILTMGGAITTGVLVRAIAEGGAPWGAELLADDMQDKELALLQAAAQLMPGILSGLVLAGVLSAAASTADSQLIVAASTASRDAYEKSLGGRRGRSQGWINRSTVLACGVVASLLVIDQRITIYEYVLAYGWAILGASFGPQLILLLLWKRATYAGCVAGMASGFIGAIAWKILGDNDLLGGIQLYNLTFAFALAMVVNVLVSMATSRRNGDQELQAPAP